MAVKTKATIGMTEVLPRFEKAWALIEKSGVKVYVDEEPSNSTSVYRAEQDGVDEYLYLHSQSMDDFRNSGYAYFGHDSVDVDVMIDIFNSVKGLTAECDDPETSKILVWADELDSDKCEWVVEESHQPEMKIWGDILADNPTLTANDIMDKIKSNSDVLEASLSTKH